MIGYTDQANHQYDLSSFWIAADSGNLPAVSYLKAPRYQDGHPANSDPLDEQAWLVNTINKLMSLPTWSSTAIIINWDDSDGWYDSVMPPIVNPSSDPANDVLNGEHLRTGSLPSRRAGQVRLRPTHPNPGDLAIRQVQLRRQHPRDQTSIVSFIEYNWNLAASTWASRPRVVRHHRRIDHEHVQLLARPAQRRQALPEPVDRRSGPEWHRRLRR